MFQEKNKIFIHFHIWQESRRYFHSFKGHYFYKSVKKKKKRVEKEPVEIKKKKQISNTCMNFVQSRLIQVVSAKGNSDRYIF